MGLLGVAASQASQGLSLWSILVFPTLFAAGMTLIDSIDGVVMVGAYGWAYLNPDPASSSTTFAITLLSVAAALVGRRGSNWLDMIGDKALRLQGRLLGRVASCRRKPLQPAGGYRDPFGLRRRLACRVPDGTRQGR